MKRSLTVCLCALALFTLCRPERAYSQADTGLAPAMPQGFDAYPKLRYSWSVVLYWLPNSESDLDHYELDVAGDPCSDLKQYLCGVFTVPGTATSFEYHNQNLGDFYWYQFRLRAVNTIGLAGPWSRTLYLTSTDAGSDETRPVTTGELFCYPNPFNASTRVQYALEEYSQVTVSIFDALGRRVVRLESGLESPGVHTLVWDGRGAGGTPMASGVYFVRLLAGREETTRQVLLLK
jgi:flagellar hook capping protein FlgD